MLTWAQKSARATGTDTTKQRGNASSKDKLNWGSEKLPHQERNTIMEITRDEAQIRMFNGTMLELLVNDNEYGMALSSMEQIDDAHTDFPYFKKSLEERAELLAEMIQEQTEWALKARIKEILENNEKEEI